MSCSKAGHTPQVWVIVDVTREESDQGENEEILSKLDIRRP